MRLLDDLLEMHDGYVLNFEDLTFAQFFAEELNVDLMIQSIPKTVHPRASALNAFYRL